MLQYNTMRFLTDEFNPYIRQALVVLKTPLNLTSYNRLDSITVQGNEPTGSKRRFMFKADDKVYKFSGSDTVEYTGDITIDNVLANGNTAAQVEAVRYNTTLAGKKVYPIVALYTEVEDAPSARLAVTASFAEEVTDLVEEQSVVKFHNDEGVTANAKILGFGWDVNSTGDASAGVKVKLLQDDTWTDYLTLTEAKGQVCSQLIPKYYYHVDAVNGTNAVQLKYFYIYYSSEWDYNVFGDTAYIFSVIKNYGMNLTGCVVVVRFEPLDGGSIEAAVNFQKKRKTVTGKVLDSALTLLEKTITLEDKFLPNTLKLYINGTKTTDFTFDTANNTVTIPFNSARQGIDNVVTADYQYDAEDEEWLPMTADDPEPTDNGLYSQRFYLKNEKVANHTIGIIRLKINRGRDVKTKTYTAVAGENYITFSHEPDDITCNSSGVWDYDADTNRFYFVAEAGEQVTVSYTWHGSTPVIRGWTAGFTT